MKNYNSTATVMRGNLHFANRAALDEFLRKLPTGAKALVEITVYEPMASIPTLVYYRKVVRPAMQKGFQALGDWKTDRQIDDLLFSECPVTQGREKIEQLSQDEANQFINWCTIYAGENLGVSV